MLMCNQCGKTIANAGNPNKLYSICIDCGKNKEMVNVTTTDGNGKVTKSKMDMREFYNDNHQLYEAERILRQHTKNTNPAYYNELIKQHFDKWRDK